MIQLRNNRSKYVGIDIQQQYIKLLVLAPQGDTYNIQKFAFTAFPEAVDTTSGIKKPDEVGAKLTELYDDKSATSDAAIAVFGSLVAVHETTLYNDCELEMQAWMEAQKFVPDLAGKINLDFHIIGKNKADANKLDVLLVICRKDMIQSYVDAIKLSGFNLKIIDVNYYALERAFSVLAKQLPEDKQNKIVGMLNLDGSIATFIVIKDNELIYSNEQTFNIKPIDNWLIDLSHGQQKAEGADVNTAKAAIAEQAFHMLQFFYAAKQNCQLDYLMLSGEHATLPDVKVDVQHRTNIETMIADPFLNMSCNKSNCEEMLHRISPAFTICCGLATRRS